MRIPLETWRAARRDYVEGTASSLPAVAAKHGLRPKTVEKHAAKERWTALRRDYEARQLTSITTAASPPLEARVTQGVRTADIVFLLCTGLFDLSHRPELNDRERQFLVKNFLTMVGFWRRLAERARDMEGESSSAPVSRPC